jgi:hypothetical protein
LFTVKPGQMQSYFLSLRRSQRRQLSEEFLKAHARNPPPGAQRRELKVKVKGKVTQG